MLEIKFRDYSGFTLIELLVVISIVGFLLISVIFSFDIIKEKTRDAKRMSDLKQMYKALNMYLDESASGGRYPNTNGLFYCFHDLQSGLDSALLNDTGLLVTIPKDPLNIQRADVPYGCYAYRSDGIDLKLMVLLENNDSLMENDGGSTNLRFELFTPAAQGWVL
ncbi:MAG: prepilin-type N-terminal cleavage/methylation domain-containing protein [Patescibacteria group bacterium]